MSRGLPRWEYGNAPLDETRRFAAVSRRVASLVLQMETPSAEVAELTATLERAEAGLAALAPRDSRPRVGAASQGDGRVYLDHSRDVGDYDPAFPVYALEVDGDRATGSVRFPLVYEGPPGLVHGGCLALLFDQIIQHHNCDAGRSGKTIGLEVRYAAPTPILTELRFEIERRVEDRRIESTARLFHGDTLCATATLRAVAGDRAALPAVSPRRAR